MDHTPAMGVGYRVTDLEERLQETTEGDRIGRASVVGGHLLFERLSLNEPHRVGRPIPDRNEPIDRDNPRVLQAGCHFRLQKETLATIRVLGLSFLQALRIAE